MTVAVDEEPFFVGGKGRGEGSLSFGKGEERKDEGKERGEFLEKGKGNF